VVVSRDGFFYWVHHIHNTTIVSFVVPFSQGHVPVFTLCKEDMSAASFTFHLRSLGGYSKVPIFTYIKFPVLKQPPNSDAQEKPSIIRNPTAALLLPHSAPKYSIKSPKQEECCYTPYLLEPQSPSKEFTNIHQK
jgi:hypothetical protein